MGEAREIAKGLTKTQIRRERIEIGGRSYRKFIPYPGPVKDGTCRCIACGQIDEPEYHDRDLCRAILQSEDQ